MLNTLHYFSKFDYIVMIIALQVSCDPYKPELSVIENPFYYNINKLLYYAHMENIKKKT